MRGYEDMMDRFRGVFILRIHTHFYENKVTDIIEYVLSESVNLDTFQIGIQSIESEAVYNRLLNFIFDSSRRSLKDLYITIPVLDTRNNLLRHLAGCRTITVLGLNVHNTAGIRFARTPDIYVLTSVTTLTLDGRDGPMLDDFILDFVQLPRLSCLTLSRMVLSKKLFEFVIRHSLGLRDLHIKSDITVWDLSDILRSCQALYELTVHYGYSLPPTFSHDFLGIVRVDYIYGTSIGSSLGFDDVSVRIASALNQFVKDGPAFFPSMCTIQLLDFHRSAFKNEMTSETRHLWSGLFNKCNSKNIEIRDELNFRISRRHLHWM